MDDQANLKRLILIGGGAYGREVAAALPMFLGYGEEWRFAGFIDNKLDRFGIADRTISLIEDYHPEPEDVFVCTLVEHEQKRKYVELMKARGAKFISLIHKTSIIDSSAVIGEGVLISAFCSVSIDVHIGDFTTTNGFMALGHDVVIGKYCHLNAYSFVGGFCHLADGATIQTHASVLPNKRVGERAVVGAGSVVVRSVRADTTVFGNPARVLRL